MVDATYREGVADTEYYEFIEEHESEIRVRRFNRVVFGDETDAIVMHSTIYVLLPEEERVVDPGQGYSALDYPKRHETEDFPFIERIRYPFDGFTVTDEEGNVLFSREDFSEDAFTRVAHGSISYYLDIGTPPECASEDEKACGD